jgi:hypothetical protein
MSGSSYGDTLETTISHAPFDPTILNHILENAVALNWIALIRVAKASLTQVEYHLDEEPSLTYLRAWSSTTRGYWSRNATVHISSPLVQR